MLESKVFIIELVTIDALSTDPTRICEVAALHHKPWDNPMEDTFEIVQWRAFPPDALFPGTQGAEVLCSLGSNMSKKLKHYSFRLSFT
jgi:hypothetical protein